MVPTLELLKMLRFPKQFWKGFNFVKHFEKLNKLGQY